MAANYSADPLKNSGSRLAPAKYHALVKPDWDTTHRPFSKEIAATSIKTTTDVPTVTWPFSEVVVRSLGNGKPIKLVVYNSISITRKDLVHYESNPLFNQITLNKAFDYTGTLKCFKLVLTYNDYSQQIALF